MIPREAGEPEPAEAGHGAESGDDGHAAPVSVTERAPGRLAAQPPQDLGGRVPPALHRDLSQAPRPGL
jgi:hypothetical protein